MLDPFGLPQIVSGRERHGAWQRAGRERLVCLTGLTATDQPGRPRFVMGSLAMLDGADLACAIIDRPDDVEAALARYEEVLFPRSRDAARRSARNLAQFFGDASPGSVVNLFSRPVAPSL